MTLEREQLLARTIEHIDPTTFDARSLIDAYGGMAYQARNLARACEIFNRMLADQRCGVILTLAGSLISAGLKKTILTLVENNMIDAIVSTGANIVDQDFFEGLGFRHFVAPGSPEAPLVDDDTLRSLMIDRIYDTYIDENDLRRCDETLTEIFDSLSPGAYSSRQLVETMGQYLDARSIETGSEPESIVLACYRKRIPIFVPAFSDCSAGFGIVLHQAKRGNNIVTFDSGQDFLELTRVKQALDETGLLMLGGGVPKNFAQDIVVAAELLESKGLAGERSGNGTPMHKYAIQFTVADSRDGALSGSTLREACSWGKVETDNEQMVFGELTALFPLLVSEAWHRRAWTERGERRLGEVLDGSRARVRTGSKDLTEASG